ncbi:elongation factor Ts, partial [Vibrio anguillarum]|nr:elongation factor Ts [Vibrio anguillarum]
VEHDCINNALANQLTELSAELDLFNDNEKGR